jgi:hypothetical protein
METESFEDDAVAGFMNEHFVCIKVDREERPDLDAIYMAAVQLMTGAGGWPLNVFLTPDLKPFYGGTYFPPQDMYGRPGFPTVLRNVAAAWQGRRADVDRSSQEITGAIRQHLSISGATVERQEGGIAPIQALRDEAVAGLRAGFDAAEGGFGSAPKFPPSPALSFLLRYYAHTRDLAPLHMVLFTLDKMAAGGLFDQVGGGFHRYATDDVWLVPHFEKMLYDNALLARAYVEAWQVTRQEPYKRVAGRTLDYVIRDLTGESGGFCSAEDADSEGEEGKFYLWTLAEINAVLGQGAGLLCAYYGVKIGGNFASSEPAHQGANILHVSADENRLAGELGIPSADVRKQIDQMNGVLLERRAHRPRPARDDKIIAAWNGLMISAFAVAAQALDEGRYRLAAERAAQFIIDRMMPEGILHRIYRRGVVRQPGFLDDYAFTAAAMLDLYELTFDLRWLDTAVRLAEAMVEQFWDASGGGFFYTSTRHPNLIARAKPVFDGAEPSPNAVAASLLTRLARLTGNNGFEDKARRTVDANLPLAARMPSAFLSLIDCAARRQLAPVEVALVGPPEREDTRALIGALHRQFLPNKIVALTDGSPESTYAGIAIPFLQGKEAVGNAATAYVCRDFSCQPPVTDPEALTRLLDE